MSEHDEQCSFFHWCDVFKERIPLLEMVFAIPNGGLRHKRVAVKMKAEGVKSGVPDVFVAVPASNYAGLFIEFKYGTNSPTNNQLAWIDSLQSQGYKCAIAYDWVTAAKTVLQYFGDDYYKLYGCLIH